MRNGSRKHAAYVPNIAALHCSIELKLQFAAKLSIFAAIFAGAVVVAIALGAAGMVIAFNTVVVLRLSLLLAGVADDLIYVRSERELSRLQRASATTHPAAAAFVSVGLPSFLPSAKLRTIM